MKVRNILIDWFIGTERTNNPFTNAFNNYSYREPTEEELKESQRIADQYMKDQEKDENEWFIEQEQELLKQLVKDCQLEEFLGGKELKSNVLSEGILDEETIKAIYNGSDSSPNLSDAETAEESSSNQSFISTPSKKNKRKRRNQKNKKKTPDKPHHVYQEPPPNSDFAFDKGVIGDKGMGILINSLDDGEARSYAEDPSLQYLIEYQIRSQQEEKLQTGYMFENDDFPSLVKNSTLDEIKRK